MNARPKRRAGARGTAIGLALVGAAAGVLAFTSTGLAGDDEPPPPPPTGDKVDLCHATGSKTNPYVPDTVDTSAVINRNNGNWQGHGNHEDDVIPALSVPRHSPPAAPGPPWQFPGLNLPAGQALLDNNCSVLAIEKTGTPTVLPGGTINYKITVTNVGLDPVKSSWVSVYDAKVALTPPADPPTFLLPGESLNWTGSRVVPDKLSKCGRWVKNTASVTLKKPQQVTTSRRARSNGVDPGNATDKSTWQTRVVCPLDVGITKSSTQASVEPGGTVTYGIRVTNPGPIPLPTSFLTVQDPSATTLTPPAEIPPVLNQGEFLDWVATKSVAADTALCGTNVDNTASVTVTVPQKEEDQLRKRANGIVLPNYTSWPKDPVVATAAGIPVSGGICPVITPSGTVTPASVTAFRPAGAALSVTKTGPARALAGGRVLYTITVTNNGGADATDVVLRDQSPAVLALVSKPAGSSVSGRNVSWNIGTLAAGQSVERTIRFISRRTATGRACNVAIASATGLDSARARACTTFVGARRPATPVTG